MSISRTEQHAHTLRAIADRLQLPSVRQMAQQPGVRAVYRLTVYHHDRRALDSVATLRRVGEEAHLTIVHERMFFIKPITHIIPLKRYESFTTGLQKLRFDHLGDQPDIPLYSLDLWMLERAAGSFVHGVIVAPAAASGAHAALIDIIQTHLPEALREIART